MIAIETRYTGNYKIAATTCNGHRILVSPPDDKSGENAHRYAAECLCRKQGWSTDDLVGAGSKAGMVWVWPKGHPHK